MALTKETAKGLWYRAAAAEIGIAISTNNRTYLKHILYQVRKSLNDPNLDKLVIYLPPDESELWLCHRDADERTAAEPVADPTDDDILGDKL